ncbi:MAG: hypothetical protein AB1736_09770 [Chloroflexota bacterium]
MSLAGSLAASLLATLARPAWWAMALAAFLIRGGILVVFLPIVALPTVAGLANAFAPALVGFVFGGPSTAFIAAVAAIVLAALAWLAVGGLVGAALDLALVRDAARDDDLEAGVRPGGGGPGRAFAVRLIAHLPTAAALGVGAVHLVEATYTELIHPGDPALPVAARVVLRIPEIVALLAATWLLGEAIGGLAVRHLAWGASVPAAIGRAIRSLVRPSGVATLIVTNAVLMATIAGSAAAAAIAWDHLRIVLMDGGPANEARLAILVFSLTWIAGLWLISLAVAWRSTAWTFEVGRRQAEVVPSPAAGTIEPHGP